MIYKTNSKQRYTMTYSLMNLCCFIGDLLLYIFQIIYNNEDLAHIILSIHCLSKCPITVKACGKYNLFRLGQTLKQTVPTYL